jgi:hypothetical protein
MGSGAERKQANPTRKAEALRDEDLPLIGLDRRFQQEFALPGAPRHVVVARGLIDLQHSVVRKPSFCAGNPSVGAAQGCSD